MSLSGIKIDEELIQKYEDARMNDGSRMVLKIEDGNIVVENEGDNLPTMIEKLPEEEPRYVLYDIPVKNRANIEDMRTVFLMWMPMKSPVRKRMMYSSTKTEITKNFRGIATSVQEEEKERLSKEFFVDKINKTQGINNPTY